MARLRTKTVAAKIRFPFGEIGGTWQPDDAEREASWEMLIELSTRVAVVDLDDDNGLVREALSSLHSLFPTVREILRRHGPDVARASRGGNLSFGVISLRVLNDVLRPVLSEWHPRLASHEAQRPPDVSPVVWERQWQHHDEARAALASVRPVVRQYVLVLAEAARVPELADAVLVKNGGIQRASRGPQRFARLRQDWSALSFRPRVHMTRWFDLVTLASTGWQMARFKLRRRDAREHFGPARSPTLDHRTGADDGNDDTHYTFDYVADLGDAFEPTMAVAWWAGRESLARHDFSAGADLDELPEAGLARGRILVLGGDEVYPYPSVRRYENQTVGPYSLALDEGSTSELVAIPGNHDWYDNLDAFASVFCDGRSFGGWQTSQTASWFSVAMPAGWWLWGVDTGLDGSLGTEQRAYFAEAAEKMRAGDRLILCSPVPAWRLREKRHDDSTDDELGHIERFLREAMPDGVSLALHIAGDTHIYAHYERRTDEGVVHHVTAGGGGAFSHPTHNLAPHVPQGHDVSDPYRLLNHWPPRSVSRSQLGRGVRGLVFDRQSFTFGAPLAALHALAALWLRGPILDAFSRTDSSLADTLVDAVGEALLSWRFVGLVAVTLMVCGLVIPKPSVAEPAVHRVARRAGFVHGAAQSTAYVLSVGMAAGLVHWLGQSSWSGLERGSTVVLLAAVIGGVLGLVIFGHYVRLVNRGWRVHDTIAFSGRHIRGYKHFVRGVVDVDTGLLRLYIVGLASIQPGWAGALAHGERPPTGSLTLVDVIDIAGPTQRVAGDDGAVPVQARS